MESDSNQAPPEPASALLVSPVAVHLVFRVGSDWEAEREQAAAELENKVQRLEDYAKSRAFKDRFGRRVGVLRLQSAAALPSVVSHLLSERGVEMQLIGVATEPSPSPCHFCQ